MPVDFSTLMSTSPPQAFGGRGFPGRGFYLDQLSSFDPDLAPSSPYACRRFQSFPLPAKAQKPCKAHSDMDLVLTSPILIPCRGQELGLPEVSLSAPSEVSVLAFGPPSLPDSEASSADSCPSFSVPEEQEEEPLKLKKTVVFADERGGCLYEIRVMKEPSDVPPKLDRSILRALLGEAACEEALPCATWFLGFTQPASAYLQFRETVAEQAVALENAILRNEECSLSGTIKVKNVCFGKEVFVRLTQDGWKTFKDYPAQYVPSSPAKAGTSAAMDTFSFRLQIPCDDETHRRLELAVCFRETESGAEHWDSNKGANFCLLSQKAGLPHSPPQPSVKPSEDAFQLNHHNWASFSVLHDLQDSHPYY